MPEEVETDQAAPQIDGETERLVREFVHTAVSRFSEELQAQEPKWEARSRWERGADGHFRETTEHKRILWLFLNAERLRSLPDWGSCIEQLKSDVVIGPHLDHLVGTDTGASRMEADTIVLSVISSMCNDQGVFAFTDEKFDHEWRKWVELFQAEQLPHKTVAPLPRLVVSGFPLQLNDELMLDRLSEDEVTRCCQVGVLQPQAPQFPLIEAGIAVGIRRTVLVPKLIRTGDEPHKVRAVEDEGRFGSRPVLRSDLVVDDVLSALRLFKHARVHAAGQASWTDSPWLGGGTSYRVLNQWPYWGNYGLSSDEVPLFLELWQLMEHGITRFHFSIHRFNLAFDRGLLADRIVDLVIAAEALFLGDLDVRPPRVALPIRATSSEVHRTPRLR